MRMRAVVIAGSLVCALGLVAVEVPLKYERYGENDRGFQPYGYVLLEKSAKAPPGDWKLPELKSAVPVYALAAIGSGKRLLILDKRDAKDSFYTRLYVDANGDGDLRNDLVSETAAPPEGENARQRPRLARFPAVDLTVDCGAYTTPFSVSAVSYFAGEMPEKGLTAEEIESERFYFYLMLNCCYRGECELAGAKLKVILADTDVNGVIEPKVVMTEVRGETAPRGDWLFLSAGDEIDYRERTFFGSLLVFKSALYDVRFDAAGKILRIEPSKAAAVTAAFPLDIERMTLVADGGGPTIMLVKSGARAAIPAGKYLPAGYRALKKDAEGDLWRIEAQATAATPYIEIPGSGAKAAFGEPFVVKATVPDALYEQYAERVKKNPEARKQLLLMLAIEGAAGERVTDLAHIEGDKTKIALEKDGERPKEPTYSIAAADGTVLGTGSFRYG